jgi:hypothetical protein
MTTQANENLRFANPRAVLHLPHAATLIPLDLREQFLLGDEGLADRMPSHSPRRLRGS